MIRKNSFVYSFLSKIRNGLWRPHLYPTESILSQYFNKKKEGLLIQIGSNDGVSNDPLRNHILCTEWHAILIEPIPSIFSQLVENYKSIENRLSFVNAVVGDHDGKVEFYSIDEQSLPMYPPYASQLSSLSKNVLLKLKSDFPNVENDIINSKLPSITFETLLKTHGHMNVDLIHIDAEGNDDRILETIDIEHYLPDIVLFEHVHLSKPSYKKLLKRFKNSSYSLFYYDFDTIAIHNKVKKQFPEIGQMQFL